MKKVILIDDESAGRKLIKQYLADYPEFVLLAEANNGVDAIEAINKFKPDLIFLDIQMPGMTGFEMLPHLEEIPQIIFSTAYDQYALQAFEVHAVDYLLKPYTKARFKKALEKLPEQGRRAGLQPLAEQMIMEQKSYPERILVERAGKLITVGVEEIQCITAAGDYSELITQSGHFLSNYGIGKLEEKLNPKHFVRIHRSSIVNLRHVQTVDKYGHGFLISLPNERQLKVSRSYTDKIKALMF